MTLFGAANLFAQQYKIVIRYDANGNRIIRERVAKAAGRPENNESLASDTLVQQNKPFGFQQLQEQTAEILVFPNPTVGNFTVELATPVMLSRTCSVLITDAVGRQIIRRQLSELRTAFDLSREADGLYMCTVIAGDKVKTFRLVKKTR